MHMIAAKIIRYKRRTNFLYQIFFFREHGLAGLYKGVDSKLLQSALAAGFMFLTYEKIAAYVLTMLGAKQIKKA